MTQAPFADGMATTSPQVSFSAFHGAIAAPSQCTTQATTAPFVSIAAMTFVTMPLLTIAVSMV